MNAQSISVINNQVQDVTLGINAEVMQGVRIINESPLTQHILFADIEDDIEPWKWATYEGQDSKIHIESFSLTGKVPANPSSIVRILAYAKGEKMPPSGHGALTKLASGTHGNDYQFATSGPKPGNAGVGINVPAVQGKIAYLVGFLASFSAPTSTPTTLEISPSNVTGGYNFYVTEHQAAPASVEYSYPQPLEATAVNQSINVQLSAGNASTHELTIWYYYS